MAAIIIATKYIEDHNAHALSIYKIVSPIYASKELNEMERSFLSVLKVIFWEVKRLCNKSLKQNENVVWFVCGFKWSGWIC